MNFTPVPIAASGRQIFRCVHCMRRIHQSATREERELEPRVGTVWADTDGIPFRDYYCTPCKEQLERE